jgi:hypothetical protein
MDDNQLENFIEQTKQFGVPDCPDSVEQNVLRRVRLSSLKSRQSAWDWLFNLFSHPGFIAGALAMVAVVSSGVSIFSTQSDADEQNNHLLAVSALDFNVFKKTELLNLDQN